MRINAKLLLLLSLIVSATLVVGCSSESLDELREDKVNLTIEIEGEGNVKDFSQGVHQLDKDAKIALEAIADEGQGYEFSEWKGEVTNKSSATTTILMDKDKIVTAVFVKHNEAIVETAEELNQAITNESVTDIILAKDITANVSATRLVNINFAGYTITGNISFNTSDSGILKLSGEGTITGDLIIATPNATVNNDATINGTTNIEDSSVIASIQGLVSIQGTSTQSFNNTGELGDVNIKLAGYFFKNRAGSKVENLNVESNNVVVENDGSEVTNINVKGQGASVSNKNGSKVVGKIEVSGDDAAVENDSSEIVEISVNAAGAKVSNKKTITKKITVGVNADGAEVDNEDSTIGDADDADSGIEIKAPNVKLRNKAGSKITGKINVSNSAIGAEVENEDSQVSEVSVDALGAKVRNKAGTTVTGRINVTADNAEIENEGTVENPVEVAEVNVNAAGVKVRNKVGSKVTGKISLGDNASNAEIENSGEVQNLELSDNSKDSATVVNEGEGQVKKANVEIYIVAITELEVIVEKGTEINLPGSITPKKLDTNGLSNGNPVQVAWENAAGTSLGNGAIKVIADEIEDRIYIGKITLPNNRVVSIKFKVNIKSEIPVDIELQDGPAQVTGVTASLDTNGDVKLNWNSVEDAAYYFVYRSESADIDTARRIADIDDTMYIDTEVTSGSYYYWIEAYNVHSLASQMSTNTFIEVK
ncbi:hypothetical protein BX659_10265 [Orenia metallireducens]|uniref:Bacterial repeat domain-containing protein n=1 Tax=Orenia metallireducens TaxID=1413210 RepID=A0A285F2G4_9FIRM|nr:hypothetical protein [Orenia metallireducens]PRX34750.1 hypothetical protein BX659_10265 [Orenia metallireducens]SNY05478.1 hypothetical protein SAMN06265827_10165 [Orenia metallireducens]